MNLANGNQSNVCREYSSLIHELHGDPSGSLGLCFKPVTNGFRQIGVGVRGVRLIVETQNRIALDQYMWVVD